MNQLTSYARAHACRGVDVTLAATEADGARQPTLEASVATSLTFHQTPILGVDLLVYSVLQQCTNWGRVVDRRNGSTETRGRKGAQEKTGIDGRAAHYGEVYVLIER